MYRAKITNIKNVLIPAYVLVHEKVMHIVWDKEVATLFPTRELALDAATDASQEGESIDAEYIAIKQG